MAKSNLTKAAGPRRIFLSHSKHDRWICERIGEQIEQAGLATWYDAFDIETGRNIADEVKKGLRRCDELLILLSPASVDSDWVKHEAGIADALDLPITVVLLHVKLHERPKPLLDRLAITINEMPEYLQRFVRSTEL